MTTLTRTTKPPLVILTGPTAAGKTDLSINLAKKINGEIISADSAQVYKGLDVGSAKITPEEMQGVPHYLINVFEPDYPFDVTVFKHLAKEKAAEITERGHIPIVVGGTGFYIQALLYDIDFDIKEPLNVDVDSTLDNNIAEVLNTSADINEKTVEVDYSYRESLEAISREEGGPERLYQELKTVDPESAESIHMNNVRKVIRALEFYHIYKKPISEHNKEQRVKESAYNSAYFVLNMDRQKLYDRINRRVDIMKDSGLVAEVKSLYDKGYDLNYTSMQAIGYKELIEEFELNGRSKASDSDNISEADLETAFDKIKLNTRHFAKRQLTWFRREKDTIWLSKDEMSEDEILDHMINILKEREIIR